LWPARDLLSAAIYLFAFLGKTVTWRGRTFRIDKAGRLIPHPPGMGEPPAPIVLGIAR
jgi:hypothetical protein